MYRSGTYAPTVLAGSAQVDQGLGRYHQQGLWEMVLVEDGVHKVTQNRRQERLVSGDVYLLQPGHCYQLHSSQGALLTHIGFLVKAAAILPDTTQPEYQLQRQEAQPDAMATWGIQLPLRLRLFEPDYLGNELRYMQALFIQGDFALLTANARLAMLLQSLVRTKADQFANTNPTAALDKVGQLSGQRNDTSAVSTTSLS
jgi:hypothetical protein